MAMTTQSNRAAWRTEVKALVAWLVVYAVAMWFLLSPEHRWYLVWAVPAAAVAWVAGTILWRRRR